ncbi:MAG: hypothetical protein INQ03_00305 [Candidatus Heimdallarchaeota archaeon]|nr:hypothetical protein [Candidatus Heimdallarchaeota archaeon]
MSKLEVEDTKEYKEAIQTKKYLKILNNYYSSEKNFDELELENVPIRELFRFMSDFGFPKKGFVSSGDRENYITKIKEEIAGIEETLKKLRLQEIQERKLNSLLVLPSWSSIIGYKTKGFYLNRPVMELKRDTIVMLSHDIITVKDKYDTELALLTGPGIFFTEFSISPGSYVTNAREVNVLLLPMLELRKLLSASPIFESDMDATVNELISILPFNLIEEAYTKQALLRGVITRNIFHPNKSSIDEFLKVMKDPKSVNPNEGFKILSAHPEYFNRMMLTQKPQKAEGDESINMTSAGIASILTNGQSLLDELIEDKAQQAELLLTFKDIKNQFNDIGRRLLEEWIG